MENSRKITTPGLIILLIASVTFLGILLCVYKNRLDKQMITDDGRLAAIKSLSETISDLKLEVKILQTDIMIARSSSAKIDKAKLQLTEWVYKHSQISQTMAEEIVNNISKSSCPLFLLSLIKTESNFNPTAVSSKGAMGLGQIMPLHKKALIEAGILKEMRDVFDISTAVKATEFIWRLKIAQANGDINRALALYLGGNDRRYVNQILKDYFQLNYLCKKPLINKKMSKEIKAENVEDNVEIIKEYVYIVKSGDTLSKIAKKVYGKVNQNILESIKNNNPDVKNMAFISVGQEIILPTIYIGGILKSPNIN
jgi:phage tail protein X